MREADSRRQRPEEPNPEWLLSAVARAATEVAQEVELDPTLERIVAGVKKHLGFDRADIFLYERERAEITCRVGINGAGRVERHCGQPLSQREPRDPVRRVLLGQIPYFLENDAIVPLAAHRQILGALAVGHARPDASVPASFIPPLCLFGRFSAAALSGAVERQRLERIRTHLDLLADACRAMAGFLDTEALFHALLPAMREMLEADRYAAWHRTPEKQWRCLACAGLSDAYLLEMERLLVSLNPQQQRNTPNWFQAGRVLALRDGDARGSGVPVPTALLSEGVRGLLGIPLVQSGELAGALFFLYADGKSIRTETVRLAELFSGYAAAVAVTTVLTQHELHQAEAHKKQFYRDIVYAVTNGKLMLCEAGEIEEQWRGSVAEQSVENEGHIRDVRDLVRRIGECAGMTNGRIEDLSLCASEAATNALKHAGGGRVWIDFDKTLVRIRVTDAGAGIDPLQLPRATLMRGYSTRASMGLGFTLMHELTDRIFLHTGPQGTTLILEMAIQPVSEAERMLALMNLTE